ncbi:tRNA uridine-5-carboxymethylaminomethyl(34) synthesis GTPase MnmE [Thioalkalivibrio denitrificans]|uniref:tRNA modification GTPase MnmE n=1 Tax=Thioalkalivibrio denitrificans TaxID=108003 RepID=A0A1V3NFE8_9GAMM|nr:tRNA uridine-5-carboxymethylaminomethyl(34) synthesis GTPase MnmE [Thioalkalivibrio denitrificans]OOG23506.1 tRNA uridine-5-carboxymethylaminomethyl(34) synthesis GTPase MnmE [Thioalkalivibrio denitrificans]
MADSPEDTIAAVATPPGVGGIGVVRVSGRRATAVAEAVLGRLPAPRRAIHAVFRGAEGEVIDDGLALYFPGPRSYTGEDVLELQGHGGPVVLDLLLTRCLALGCRAAHPGEFTERAFLNGRLDLAQAEAVADLIEAGSAQAARSARRALEGALSNQVDELLERLTALRVSVEAALDFPDEDVDILREAQVAERLNALDERLDTLRAGASQGALLREGMRLVIAGRPNAGKSSLLNRLVQREAAIVTHIPGTTRDVLRETVSLDGLPLHVIDTAGLRESDDPVEQEGIRRAWSEIETADAVLLVIDDTLGEGDAEAAMRARFPKSLPVITAHNKIDLSGAAPGERDARIYLSAVTGEGVDHLRAHLKAQTGYAGGEGLFLARRRHLDALDRTASHVANASRALAQSRAPELVAEDLRLAQESLGEITGRFSSDDLLGRIFSTFCIGK